MKDVTVRLFTNIILLGVTGLLLMILMLVLINSLSQQVNSLRQIQQLNEEINILETPQMVAEHPTKQNMAAEIKYQKEVKVKQRNAIEAESGWFISILISLGIWISAIIFTRVVSNLTDDFFYPKLQECIKWFF